WGSGGGASHLGSAQPPDRGRTARERGHREALPSGRLGRVAAAREQRVRADQSGSERGAAAHRRDRRGCGTAWPCERLYVNLSGLAWSSATRKSLGCSSILPSGAAAAPRSDRVCPPDLRRSMNTCLTAAGPAPV